MDALIATIIGGYTYEKRGRDQKPWFYPENGSWRRQLVSYGPDRLDSYTASLDAAKALAERVLGPHTTEVHAWPDITNVCIKLLDDTGWFVSEDARGDAFHKSEPIARIIAILKAKEASHDNA
ncbi:hypothetical protein [Brucella sp. IR073]|uniref:hypothetical protein n=1 Tax=unclassified Brucella TaxID=2632610 RepID=UPI003B97FC7E